MTFANAGRTVQQNRRQLQTVPAFMRAAAHVRPDQFIGRTHRHNLAIAGRAEDLTQGLMFINPDLFAQHVIAPEDFLAGAAAADL